MMNRRRLVTGEASPSFHPIGSEGTTTGGGWVYFPGGPSGSPGVPKSVQ
jgi:hypothetical protein